VHGLDDWGTWNTNDVQVPDAWTIKNGTFKQHNVLDSAHPQYQECKNMIQAIMSASPQNVFFSFDLQAKLR